MINFIRCARLFERLKSRAHPTFELDDASWNSNCLVEIVNNSFTEYGSDPGGGIEFGDEYMEGDIPTFFPHEKTRRITDCRGRVTEVHVGKGGYELGGTHVHFRGSGNRVIRCLVEKLLEEP